MSQTPQTPYPADDAGARAAEVTDSPDALTDPDVDEVRADSGDDVVGDLEDQYEMRSMPAQPNPTEDDPGSHLNF